MEVGGESKTIALGRVAVTDGRLRIGDAWFPPRGTDVDDLPTGEFQVTGIVVDDRRGGEEIGSIRIVFDAAVGDPAEGETFSIDGGIVAVADPNVDVPSSCLERGRRRRACERQLMTLYNGGLQHETLRRTNGVPWMVAFCVADGIYPITVFRNGGRALSIMCDFMPVLPETSKT